MPQLHADADAAAHIELIQGKRRWRLRARHRMGQAVDRQQSPTGDGRSKLQL